MQSLYHSLEPRLGETAPITKALREILWFC